MYLCCFVVFVYYCCSRSIIFVDPFFSLQTFLDWKLAKLIMQKPVRNLQCQTGCALHMMNKLRQISGSLFLQLQIFRCI